MNPPVMQYGLVDLLFKANDMVRLVDSNWGLYMAMLFKEHIPFMTVEPCHFRFLFEGIDILGSPGNPLKPQPSARDLDDKG